MPRVVIIVGGLPLGIQALVARHVANQEMIVQSALSGGRNLALRALLDDLLLRDLECAEPMLAANRQCLLRFF